MFAVLDMYILSLLNGWVGEIRFIDGLIIVFAQYIPFIVPVAFLLLLLHSAYTQKKRFFIAVSVFLSATIAYLGGVNLTHSFYNRPRPFLVYDIEHLFIENSSSFPSGHSLFFFALAGAIYHFNKKWGSFFLFLAFLIGIARIMAGVHYPSDVLVGAFIGFLVSYSIVRCIEKYYVRKH